MEGIRRDFVAHASHELKTPLTVIRGYSETLLDPELDPEQRRKFTTTIHQNATRLQSILEDLLELSRIESGGWAIDTEPVSLPEIAGEAWESFADRAAEKGIGLAIDIPEGCDPVRADPDALRQILSNLFSNAVRYTPAGGRIDLAASRAPSGELRIEVRDTGSGIPGPALGRIFERFYRVDPARSRADGGTGLGLAIVRHLVERHGGRVEAESELGRGTTIRFTLPG